WRKKPSIKRVVIKGVPDRTTRLAMLKTGEADIGYLMVGVEAATIKADPKLRLAQTIAPATWWVEFPEQWNPKSPWADRRVRLAAMEAWRGKKLGGVTVTVSAAPGNTSARLESFVISGAPYASGGYLDIDDLFRQQAGERDRKKREVLLNQIQRLMYERVMFG